MNSIEKINHTEVNNDTWIQELSNLYNTVLITKNLLETKQNILSEKEYQEYLHKPALSLEKGIFNQVMTRRINELRDIEGLQPLTYDKKLEGIAQNFGEELTQKDIFSISNPHKDNDGNFVLGRIRKNGLDSYIDMKQKVAENIATVGLQSIEQILQRLLKSPGHKRALMSNTDIVGFSHTDPVVQVFAKKKK